MNQQVRASSSEHDEVLFFLLINSKEKNLMSVRNPLKDILNEIRRYNKQANYTQLWLSNKFLEYSCVQATSSIFWWFQSVQAGTRLNYEYLPQQNRIHTKIRACGEKWPICSSCTTYYGIRSKNHCTDPILCFQITHFTYPLPKERYWPEVSIWIVSKDVPWTITFCFFREPGLLSAVQWMSNRN